MPRYLMETGATSDVHLDRAIRLVAQRFPEVVVEQRYTACDIDCSELWACGAPNAAHVERWAAAAQLEVRSLHQVTCGAPRVQRPSGDAHDRPSHGPRPQEALPHQPRT